MPQSRAEELTYYDELGIARNASPDQVREAFRSLVRLLHPDQHTDEQLKAVAEHQMRKLNRIYAVLSDPSKRRAYDELLDEKPAPAQPQMGERIVELGSNRTVSRLAWVGAVVISVALLTWLASEGADMVGSLTGDKPSAVAPVPSETGARGPDLASELTRTRTDLKIARFERDSAVHELERLRGHTNTVAPTPPPETGHPDAAPSGLMGTMTELPGAQTTTSAPGGNPAPLPAAAHIPPKALTGFWFYLRTPEDKKNPGLYPPEFIEATISEQNGIVKGRYRSRYRIVDRAISPDVNFEFNGKVSGNLISASWAGPGGAHGDLTIRLLSENSMRVEWSADQLGSIQGLTSGTAALTRRLD